MKEDIKLKHLLVMPQKKPEKIYENIYDIIISEINDLMGIGGNIVKYKCSSCKESYNLILKPPIGGNTCCSCWNSNLGN